MSTQLLPLAALLALTLRAQPCYPRPQFEVAAIRPSSSELNFGPHCEGSGGAPGRLILKCITVRELIQFAYGFYRNGRTPTPQTLQISSGPRWIDSDRFDIEAKAEGTPQNEMLAGPMLQTLLEDRFKLKVHREMRERPVYLMTVARSGLKLQPLKEACQVPDPCGVAKMRSNGQNMTLDVHAMSMTDFAASLGLDRAVIDKTAVAGIFDFHLEFVLDSATPGNPFGSHEPAPSGEGAGPSIFTAIQTLGLRLESAKGHVEFLVIDHVERPSEN
jgi:uncharacterized protein (TIGR03435 family)